MLRRKLFYAVCLALTALAVGATFFGPEAGLPEGVQAVSGFAAGLFKAMLGVGLWALFDRFVLADIDTIAEIRKGNVAFGLLLLAVALLISASVATAQTAPPFPGDYAAGGELVDRTGRPFVSSGVPHLDAALAEVGTTETGRNCGRGPRAYLRSVGLGCGYAWCAAFTSWALSEGRADGPRRRDGSVVRTAGARRFNEAVTTIPARLVLRGTHRVPPGSIVTWQRGNGWQGHSAMVVRDDNARRRGLDWYARCGLTVEGNTSSGRAGSQRDGDGVYRRSRCISPGSHFRITDFTLV